MILLEGVPRSWALDAAPTAVTVGVYDGVHRGHQAVLAALREGGEARVAVVTFRQHPATIVAPGRAPRLITSLEQRIELLAHYGADIVALLDFDDGFRRLAAATFVEQVLVGALHATSVAVGDGFRFGYGLEGDVALLRELGGQHGFTVADVPIFGGDDPVRSTAIRDALEEGDVARAASMLGRPFQVRGVVLRGDGRGRDLGFPTANIEVPAGLARPRRGVYAAWAGRRSVDRPAVVNVGVRPTVDGSRELVEVHLLDGPAELYGEEVWVDFVARLRDEVRFANLDALVSQITADADRARALLTTRT